MTDIRCICRIRVSALTSGAEVHGSRLADSVQRNTFKTVPTVNVLLITNGNKLKHIRARPCAHAANATS